MNDGLVIGYSPDDNGYLIRAQYWDVRGNWVEPIYPGDDIVAAAATERDGRVLGVVTGTVVLHVLRSGTSMREVYRSDRASFHPLPAEARDWSDEQTDQYMSMAADLRYAADERDWRAPMVAGRAVQSGDG